MKITILGSCRQQSLYDLYDITTIQNKISYPHYTKEVLEVINFCKFGSIKSEDTTHIFRTPALTKIPIQFSETLKTEFESSDLFVIEIASKLSYKLNDNYVHSIFYDDSNYNEHTKNLIKVERQSDNEIEDDIIKIKQLLNKPIIIVSHLVTRNIGSRYELAELLKKICKKHNILFINPIEEIKKKGYNIDGLFPVEDILHHYNSNGHEIIKSIYSDFILQIQTI